MRHTNNHFFTLQSIGIFILAIILVCATYYNIDAVPFYLDDFSSIVYNPVVQYPVDYAQIWQANAARFIPYSFFALQTGWFDLQPNGFHWFGLFLHGGVSLLVGMLACALSKRGGCNRQECYNVALLSSCLFGLLPQNTQAVIYIVQQISLWTALFYLVALLCYCQWRQETQRKYQCFWALGLGLAIIGATLSKQNSATLPLAILLIEWLFFGSWLKRLFSIYLSFFVVLVCGLTLSMGWDELLTWLDAASRETALIPRLDYFASQLAIVWHYIGQYFFPTTLRLEYDTDLVNHWGGVQYLLLVAHVMLLGLAFLLRKRMVLFSFGILFYYLAHVIESSFFPIKDIVFEHRTYLPNVGMSLAVVALLTRCYQCFFAKPSRYIQMVTYFIIIALFAAMGWKVHQRIDQWSEPMIFYQNEIAQSPNSARSNAIYAGLLLEDNQCPLALGYFEHSIALYKKQDGSGLGLTSEIVQNYISCLRVLGIDDKANYYELDLLKQIHEPVTRSRILSHRGKYLLDKSANVEAEKVLTAAVKLNHKNLEAILNLILCKLRLGKNYHAKKLLEQAFILDPKNPFAEKLNAVLAQSSTKS